MLAQTSAEICPPPKPKIRATSLPLLSPFDRPARAYYSTAQPWRGDSTTESSISIP